MQYPWHHTFLVWTYEQRMWVSMRNFIQMYKHTHGWLSWRDATRCDELVYLHLNLRNRCCQEGPRGLELSFFDRAVDTMIWTRKQRRNKRQKPRILIYCVKNAENGVLVTQTKHTKICALESCTSVTWVPGCRAGWDNDGVKRENHQAAVTCGDRTLQISAADVAYWSYTQRHKYRFVTAG